MGWDSTTRMMTLPITLQSLRDFSGLNLTTLKALIDAISFNKFSKFKPVSSAATETVAGQWDEATQQWIDFGNGTNWWVAGGNCGLSFDVYHTIGTLSNQNSFLYKLANGLLPWGYTKPSGGVNSIYRIQDLRNYYDDAVPPVGRLAGAGGTIYVPSSGSGMRTLTLNYEMPSNPQYNLTLSDFYYQGTRFTNYYLAVALIKGGNWIVASNETPIGDTGSTVIETQIGYSDIGTWQVIPFISSVNINAYGEQQVGNYFSAGYDTPDTITIASATSIEQIIAEAVFTNAAKTQVGFRATCYNDSSTGATHVGGLTFYIYETDISATTGAAGSLVAQLAYSSNVSVPANDDYTLPQNVYISAISDYVVATLNVPAPPSGKKYWVTAIYNDGTQTDNQWNEIEEVIMQI